MRMRHKKLWIISIVLVGTIAIILGILFGNKAAAPKADHGATVSQASQSSTFNKTQYSTSDPTSIWVVVNKQHALNPKNYTPANLVFPNVPLRVPGNESMQLREDTANALEALVAAAKSDGLNLMLASGYRSYNYQVGLYNGYVKSMGQAEADKTSARPGHSEHQTGLAFDLEPTNKECELETCFGDIPDGQWLAAEAYKYGFIIRYPADKVSVTGYEYEPWHLRYIGKELSAEMHKQHITTLETFFGITGGTQY
ncbi:MAG TPA: M15 family metallopeptidase [Candidatus Saccharimonadales bacterium]|nr:M15 family metallopeptidase [Candidatus Saccharimonadales bacterium]